MEWTSGHDRARSGRNALPLDNPLTKKSHARVISLTYSSFFSYSPWFSMQSMMLKPTLRPSSQFYKVLQAKAADIHQGASGCLTNHLQWTPTPTTLSLLVSTTQMQTYTGLESRQIVHIGKNLKMEAPRYGGDGKGGWVFRFILM